jgi:predicted AlkP superfamily phosphohydrolase/phosphomutase
VKQAKQVYHGPLVGEAPDVIWVPDKWITINQSPLSDEMFSDRLTYLKGDHYADRNGIIAAWGEGIKNSVKIDAHIEDILPTILYLLGVPITEKLDGKVIGQFSRKNHKTNKISEQQRIEMLINQQLEDINKN